jgi:hypothetical protein
MSSSTKELPAELRDAAGRERPQRSKDVLLTEAADEIERLRREAAREVLDLRLALVHAVSVIETWHNMDIRPQSARSELWDIYWKNAPEMKPIRAALKSN